MNPVAKLLILGGIIMIIVGLLWAVGGKFLNFGRLPGDIAVEKENVKFYFPIVTCIVISVVLSLVMYVIRWFMK
jgi:heme/copper-type cytochrome/quinol oxidase subunit 2